MLEIKDINVYYGAIHAIKGITLTVNDGELVSLVGANGAGKPPSCIRFPAYSVRQPVKYCWMARIFKR